MRKLVDEVPGEGLDALLGEKVLLICLRYFYVGKLVGVNDSCVLLENPSIVYETGKWEQKQYSNLENMNVEKFYVSRGSIEAFGRSK